MNTLFLFLTLHAISKKCTCAESLNEIDLYEDTLLLEPFNQTEDSPIDDYEEASNENKSEEESTEIEDIGKIEDEQKNGTEEKEENNTNLAELERTSAKIDKDDSEEDDDHDCKEERKRKKLDKDELTNKIKCLDKSPRYRKRPDGTMNVEVDLSIISISALNLENMELRVEIYLTQMWTDKRCMFRVLPRQESEVTLQGHGLEDLHNLLNHLWMPDTYFINAKETLGHDTPQPQQNTKVRFSGEVIHSTRLTVTAACPLSLWLFPFDQQHCSLILQSYSFHNKQLEYIWNKEQPLFFEHTIDYQDRMMPEVLLIGYRLGKNTIERRGGKKYSQLQLDLYMMRPLGHYLFDLYLPAVCIVFMSWINFWLTRSAGPERVGLGITIVLTLTTHMANANSNLPKTSYPKAVGIYLSVCFLFTFAGLLENIIASIEKKKENPNSQLRLKLDQKRIKKLRKQGRDRDSMDSMPTTPALLLNDLERPLAKGNSGRNDFNTIASMSQVSTNTIPEKVLATIWPRTADQKSRIYFPFTFFLFNLVYWITCCTIGDRFPSDAVLLRNSSIFHRPLMHH